MIERILTVGGLTLLSRITGFVRDIVLAAILGAGPAAGHVHIQRVILVSRPGQPLQCPTNYSLQA
jgi:hypothetical protein